MNHITTTQAAKLLRVHPNSVVRLLDKAGVKYEMVGKSRAYQASDVERIAAARNKAKASDVERVAAARNKATALEMIKQFRGRR